MDLSEFFKTVVQPNVAEFNADYGDIRRAYNAVAAIDALAAHIYVWCKTNAPSEIAGLADDTYYRERLAGCSSDFRLLRDIAKAQKHVHIDRGQPEVTTSAQVTARAFGYGQGGIRQGSLWRSTPSGGHHRQRRTPLRRANRGCRA